MGGPLGEKVSQRQTVVLEQSLGTLLGGHEALDRGGEED